MPTLLPARTARAVLLAAMVAVPTVAVTVAATPAHAATTAVAAKPHYTLTVTGNGTKSLVFWSTARRGGSSTGTTSGFPVTTLPWHKSVTTKADLYQVVAVQQRGTRLSCSIRNSHGRILSTATSYGRNAVVTCTLSKRDLFSLSALG
jgi:hypothetical protein